VFIVELSLACANGAQVSGLYSYLNARVIGTEKWTDQLVLFLECCPLCRCQWKTVSCDQRPRCWQISGI